MKLLPTLHDILIFLQYYALMGTEITVQSIMRALGAPPSSTALSPIQGEESYLARFAKARLAGIIFLNAEHNSGVPNFSQIAEIFYRRELPTLARYIATPEYQVPADQITAATLSVFSEACERARQYLENPTSHENQAFHRLALRHAALAGYTTAAHVGAGQRQISI